MVKEETPSKKKINSRAKGKAGELEWSHHCQEQGYDTRRSQQYSGVGEDAADIIGIKGVHQEVKRIERLNLYDAMAQSIRDANPDEMPIVAHRRNRGKWMVTLPAEWWFMLLKMSRWVEWQGVDTLGYLEPQRVAIPKKEE